MPACHCNPLLHPLFIGCCSGKGMYGIVTDRPLIPAAQWKDTHLPPRLAQSTIHQHYSAPSIFEYYYPKASPSRSLSFFSLFPLHPTNIFLPSRFFLSSYSKKLPPIFRFPISFCFFFPSIVSTPVFLFSTHIYFSVLYISFLRFIDLPPLLRCWCLYTLLPL